MTYQDEVYAQELQERIDSAIQDAVETEIDRILNSASCFDCDNPLTVLRTENGRIAIRACEKCSGIDLSEMDETVKRINSLTMQINGRV